MNEDINIDEFNKRLLNAFPMLNITKGSCGNYYRYGIDHSLLGMLQPPITEQDYLNFTKYIEQFLKDKNNEQ